MRRSLLLMLLGVAAANPPALSPAQQAWLVAWMNQLQVSSQHPAFTAVWDYYASELLAGNIDINPPPVDPDEPMLSETTCNHLATDITTKAQECNVKRAAEASCRGNVPATEDPESVCSAEIGQVIACGLEEGDLREDYRKGCKGRYPPAH